MKNKISKENIYKIISKILKVPEKKLIKIDKLKSIESWDSMAQLDILSAIDEKLGNKLSNLNEIASITSIKKLINLLKKKSLLK